jgi:hypothetical protein
MEFNIIAILFSIIGFLLTGSFVIYNLVTKNLLSKENYITQAFIPTLFGTILFFIGLFIYFYSNYSEELLFYPLLVSSITGITFSTIVIFLSEYRQRFAT